MSIQTSNRCLDPLHPEYSKTFRHYTGVPQVCGGLSSIRSLSGSGTRTNSPLSVVSVARARECYCRRRRSPFERAFVAALASKLCPEYGRSARALTTQHGYIRALEGLHLGQVFHGTAEILGD